jgi:hypothetical protein
MFVGLAERAFDFGASGDFCLMGDFGLIFAKNDF